MKLLGLNIQREATTAPSTPAPQVQGGSFADNTVQVHTQDRALSVSAWYCGLAMKAKTFGQMVLEYQKRNDRAHGGNYEVYDYGFAKAINFMTQVQPNPLMTSVNMWEQAVIEREVFGNAIFYIERDGKGDPYHIWLCTSGEINFSTMEYTVTYYKPSIGEVTVTVPQSDIIHWANTYRHHNRIMGVGTLRYAGQSLSTAATNDWQALDIAAKGGKYKFLLKEERQPDFGVNMLTKDQQQSAKDEMQEALRNGDDVIRLNGLFTPTIISQTAQEMNLLESRKFDIPTIARFLQIPLVLLMDYTNNTYKAPEQAMQAFLQYTIAPMAAELEAEFNAKLVGRLAYPTLRYHFNDTNLTRLDPKGRMDVAKAQLECGIKCVNELRRDFDLPAIQDGDTHLVSTNLQRLDDIKVGGNQATQPQPQPKKDEEDE